MARKKRPIIQSKDPNYTSEFKPIPTNEPAKSAQENTVQPLPPTEVAVVAPPPIVEDSSSLKTLQNESAKDRAPSIGETKDNQDDVSFRQVSLDAHVLKRHATRIAPLEEKGLKFKDIVKLAGRKTNAAFVFDGKYIPKEEAERMPAKLGYHTSKRLPADMLDTLRKKHDPLGVSSDHAMVRGQFEKLFWSTLDTVLDDLEKRFL